MLVFTLFVPGIALARGGSNIIADTLPIQQHKSMQKLNFKFG